MFRKLSLVFGLALLAISTHPCAGAELAGWQQPGEGGSHSHAQADWSRANAGAWSLALINMSTFIGGVCESGSSAVHRWGSVDAQYAMYDLGTSNGVGTWWQFRLQYTDGGTQYQLYSPAGGAYDLASSTNQYSWQSWPL
jgi:hypothetical protein